MTRSSVRSRSAPPDLLIRSYPRGVGRTICDPHHGPTLAGKDAKRGGPAGPPVGQACCAPIRPPSPPNGPARPAPGRSKANWRRTGRCRRCAARRETRAAERRGCRLDGARRSANALGDRGQGSEAVLAGALDDFGGVHFGGSLFIGWGAENFRVSGCAWRRSLAGQRQGRDGRFAAARLPRAPPSKAAWPGCCLRRGPSRVGRG